MHPFLMFNYFSAIHISPQKLSKSRMIAQKISLIMLLSNYWIQMFMFESQKQG